MSIGFNRDRNRRRDELTNNKNIKGKYRLINLLKDVFGFAQHQNKATFRLGYRVTPTRKKDETVLEKTVGFGDARNKIDHIHWSLPHY